MHLVSQHYSMSPGKLYFWQLPSTAHGRRVWIASTLLLPESWPGGVQVVPLPNFNLGVTVQMKPDRTHTLQLNPQGLLIEPLPMPSSSTCHQKSMYLVSCSHIRLLTLGHTFYSRRNETLGKFDPVQTKLPGWHSMPVLIWTSPSFSKGWPKTWTFMALFMEWPVTHAVCSVHKIESFPFKMSLFTTWLQLKYITIIKIQTLEMLHFTLQLSNPSVT